jgi:hypothetical protein
LITCALLVVVAAVQIQPVAVGLAGLELGHHKL